MGQPKEHWLSLLMALQQEWVEVKLAGKLTDEKEKQLNKRERWLERQYEKAGGVFPVDAERIKRAKNAGK